MSQSKFAVVAVKWVEPIVTLDRTSIGGLLDFFKCKHDDCPGSNLAKVSSVLPQPAVTYVLVFDGEASAYAWIAANAADFDFVYPVPPSP